MLSAQWTHHKTQQTQSNNKCNQINTVICEQIEFKRQITSYFKAKMEFIIKECMLIILIHFVCYHCKCIQYGWCRCLLHFKKLLYSTSQLFFIIVFYFDFAQQYSPREKSQYSRLYKKNYIKCIATKPLNFFSSLKSI